MGTYAFNYFDRIFYLNLAHREDRKAALLSELEKANVDMDRVERIEAIYDPTCGHRGCAKTHLLAIERAKALNLSNVLILEDDAYFRKEPSFVDEMVSRFVSVVEEWDVFLLGSHVLNYEPTSYHEIYKVKIAQAAQAYWVNGHYFDQMIQVLKMCLTIMGEALFQPTPIPLDWFWNTLIQKDRWYCSQIVLHQRPGYSDIFLDYRKRCHPTLEQMDT